MVVDKIKGVQEDVMGLSEMSTTTTTMTEGLGKSCLSFSLTLPAMTLPTLPKTISFTHSFLDHSLPTLLFCIRFGIYRWIDPVPGLDELIAQ